MLTKIVCQVESLFDSVDCHWKGENDIMVNVAFRIVFVFDDEGDNSFSKTIKDAIKNSKCLNQIKIKSKEDTKIVDTSVIAVVFKSKNRGELNRICDLCYADPKFEYDCECWMT